ncbi:MAG TPA: gluconate 2-dehydrogenase subunit 3 family protein [Gemmatimonadaceae bacterium]|nr:gluconate 2-dehydrogenase subunit 3 family protein [Gemmatimonadaceae bacterium]
MDRRTLLKSLAAAGASSLLPHDAFAAWERVASGVAPRDGLSEAQLAHIGAIADVILPRTETPSATDVGVPAFIDVIVSEQMTEVDRQTFVANLDAIDPAALDAIESSSDRRGEPAHTYWRLKDLIVYGYFTSEPVMKTVLHYEVMPGKFDGGAPMPMAMPHG